jgi:hypothetical protein
VYESHTCSMSSERHHLFLHTLVTIFWEVFCFCGCLFGLVSSKSQLTVKTLQKIPLVFQGLFITNFYRYFNKN